LIATSPDTTIMPLATAKIWLRRNGSMRREMRRKLDLGSRKYLKVMSNQGSM